MSAGTSLKATHSCYRSFQPLPENSKQKTYSPILPWLVWFWCPSTEKKLDCIQWQSCHQAVLVKLPWLRDYLLPDASELRNLCGHYRSASFIFCFACCFALCCFHFLIYMDNLEQNWEGGEVCLHHSFSLYLFCSFNGPTSSGPDPPLLMVVQLTDRAG